MWITKQKRREYILIEFLRQIPFYSTSWSIAPLLLIPFIVQVDNHNKHMPNWETKSTL